MSDLISVAEALRRVLDSAASPLEEEFVALDAAFGRTLARDIAAKRSQPPFANSAMDGYALRAADAADPPAALTLIGEAAAGKRVFRLRRAPPGGAHFHRRADARRRGYGGRAGGGQAQRRSDRDFDPPRAARKRARAGIRF